jgi:hypothetical protein
MTPHQATCLHEAAHAVSARMLGLDIEEVRVDGGEPGSHGSTRYSSIQDPPEWLVQVHANNVSGLMGYLVEGAPLWPPTYDAALTEEREGLGRVLKLVGIEREAYNLLAQAARRLAVDPIFTYNCAFLAEALSLVPRISGQQVADLLD